MEQQGAKTTVNIVLGGFGEIATKAHLPAIQRSDNNFRLVAIVDPNRDAALERLSHFSLSEEDIGVYQSLSSCLQDCNHYDIDAVAVCTPSTVTLDLALVAIRAGKHVLVEKPPGDWRRLREIKQMAEGQQLAFFTAYHTAACVGYPLAKSWLNKNLDSLQKVHVTWKESVKKWHPGQIWVTRKGTSAVQGCDGVLDIVFNPLSLLYALLGPLTYQESNLEVPKNWETPIAGSFNLIAANNDKGIPVTGDFAWNYEPASGAGPGEIWTIDFESSNSSVMSLQDGGNQEYVDSERVTSEPTAPYPLKPEYENIYRTFANLIETSTSSVDDTTPKLLEEIQGNAEIRSGPPYEL
ncbi:1-dehydrogenase [Seminavis robusta]|uniref:1-dehydrogenase n=1 Tax=Seminavis robusta TaxID=568900 RepID=A0A9N8DTJ5_9STRA|nr:1-dehydrogenase [Seminavis robusta]|eukprot:Sro360_g126240.1 1-dehydrogenase (352) ;mRNA; r:37186-38241